MFCTQCGSQNPDNSKFCQGCGGRLAVEQPAAAPLPPPPTTTPASRQASVAPGPTERVCPNCRSQVSEDKAFCTSCGTPMSGPARQQPIPPPVQPQAARGPRPGGLLVGAGVGIRAVAVIIDGIIISIVCYVLIALFGTSSSSMGGSGVEASFNLSGVSALVFILFPIVYYVGLEGTIGATIGKLAMGLKVVKTDGGKSTFGTAIIRFLLWIVDGLIFIPLVGMIMIWTTKQKQRLGDKAAGTVVIKKNAASARRGGTYNDDYGWDSSSDSSYSHHDSGHSYDSSSSSYDD